MDIDELYPLDPANSKIGLHTDDQNATTVFGKIAKLQEMSSMI